MICELGSGSFHCTKCSGCSIMAESSECDLEEWTAVHESEFKAKVGHSYTCHLFLSHVVQCPVVVA
jgi:hypothetical protein